MSQIVMITDYYELRVYVPDEVTRMSQIVMITDYYSPASNGGGFRRRLATFTQDKPSRRRLEGG